MEVWPHLHTPTSPFLSCTHDLVILLHTISTAFFPSYISFEEKVDTTEKEVTATSVAGVITPPLFTTTLSCTFLELEEDKGAELITNQEGSQYNSLDTEFLVNRINANG